MCYLMMMTDVDESPESCSDTAYRFGDIGLDKSLTANLGRYE